MNDGAGAEAGAALRAELARVRGQMAAAILAGVPGDEVAAALAEVYDRAIAARWRAATADIAAPLALVATGAWARRELAPYSDLDFILVHAGAEAAARTVADRLLYPLWDAKVAVGHAVREPRECVRLARDDLATATALVDLRPLVGDPRLAEQLTVAARGAIAPAGDADRLITALAADQARRHARFGDSLYRLEPNLKQGHGGLRDLATACWAARARWLLADTPWPVPGDTVARLGERGHLRPREVAALTAARRFLLGLRALVQLRVGRASDQLTFELQEAIAPALNPMLAPTEPGPRAAVAPAVEALMRDFYLHGRAADDIGQRLIERARVPPRRAPRAHRIDDTIVEVDGAIALVDAAVLATRPAEIVRLWRVAVARGEPVTAACQDAIAEAVPRCAAALHEDRDAARWFVEALCDPRDRGQPSALEELHRLGVVDALLPEWAPCTGRVQHDLYHVYTVDQHQLYAVAMLKQLARGELADVHPMATAAYAQVVDVAPLYLATLLHDVGKPLGKGHSEKGAVVAGAIAARLGFTAAQIAVVELLVRQHLTMAHVSQRRDLSDPDVIARFVERLGDPARVPELYVLTLCDTAMTAPDSLTAWKAELLRELYVRATEGAGPNPAPDVPSSLEACASPTYPALHLDPGIAASIAAGLDRRFAAQLTAEQAARHVRLAAAVQARGGTVGVAVTALPAAGGSEVAVVAPDVHGVLAAIAGGLAAHRVDVLGAVVGRAITPTGALALDLFFVRGAAGAVLDADDPRWRRLEDDLATLCADGPPASAAVAALLARRRPRSGLPARLTPEVATEVRFDLDESADATIVEVFARDRPGLLHAITAALADAGLDIALSKITTEGEKVADVFYVSAGGEKLVEPDALAAVARAITDALGGLD